MPISSSRLAQYQPRTEPPSEPNSTLERPPGTPLGPLLLNARAVMEIFLKSSLATASPEGSDLLSPLFDSCLSSLPSWAQVCPWDLTRRMLGADVHQAIGQRRPHAAAYPRWTTVHTPLQTYLRRAHSPAIRSSLLGKFRTVIRIRACKIHDSMRSVGDRRGSFQWCDRCRWSYGANGSRSLDRPCEGAWSNSPHGFATSIVKWNLSQ